MKRCEEEFVPAHAPAASASTRRYSYDGKSGVGTRDNARSHIRTAVYEYDPTDNLVRVDASPGLDRRIIAPNNPERWSDEKCAALQARMSSLSRMGKEIINQDMNLADLNRFIGNTGRAQIGTNIVLSGVTGGVQAVLSIRTAAAKWAAYFPEWIWKVPETRERILGELMATEELVAVGTTIGKEAAQNAILSKLNLDITDIQQGMLWERFDKLLDQVGAAHSQVLQQFGEQKALYEKHCR